MKNKKNKSKVLVSTGLLLFLLFVGMTALLFLKQNISSKKNSDIVPVSTSDSWKNHSDDTKGFSLDIPNNWKVSTLENAGYGYSFQSPDLKGDRGGPQVIAGSYLRIFDIQEKFPTNGSLEAWFTDYSNQEQFPEILSEPIFTEINGYLAVIYDKDDGYWGKARSIIVADKVSGKMFRFDCYYVEATKLESTGMCENIVSTILFH